VKGHAVTRPRDVPYGEAPLLLVWHKRRWRCLEAACSRGSFTESLPAVPARARVTTRLRRECGAGIATRFSCVKAGAEYYAVSWPIARAAFAAHVDPVLAQPLPPVEVLGIDETRRGKVQWGQDPDTGRWFVVADRWHTGIVDAAGTGGLLGHIDGRTAAKVADWIAEQPDSWRAGITHVTIDLWLPPNRASSSSRHESASAQMSRRGLVALDMVARWILMSSIRCRSLGGTFCYSGLGSRPT
jgi:hypothetical protein